MNYGFIKVGTAVPKISVADCSGNAAKIIELMKAAYKMKVKILCFPELCVTGYTCADLFFQYTLIDAAERTLMEIRDAGREMDMLTVIGLPVLHGGKLYNCAAVLFKGKILGIIPKTNIPNYSEYYERRHFLPAPDQNETIIFGREEVPFGCRLLFECGNFMGLTIAAEICEDLWVPHSPSLDCALLGATIILNPSAGDEVIGKHAYRRNLVSSSSAKLICAYVYAGAGEGESTQDMVFSGHSIISENGKIIAETKLFENGIITGDIDIERLVSERMKTTTFVTKTDNRYLRIKFNFDDTSNELNRYIEKRPFVPADAGQRNEVCSEILTMQAMGLKKRIEHTNTSSVVIGVSGGLDSTLALLVAARAYDMLKRPRDGIIAVTMPCFGTTRRTKSNAESLCERLGVTLKTVDITEAVNIHFRDIGQDAEHLDVTYENSQARERTQVLMDIANKTGGFVVGTGDLSELALGWATYNGDHMSMYGVNSSIPKTLVRHLVKYAADSAENKALSETLESILDTPVSPELLPPDKGNISQKTENIVGPYDLHDFFLYYFVRFGFSPDKILFLACSAFKDEYTPETILSWLKVFVKRFFSQQFKRSCLPDGPKVGTVTLSPRGDWRMPSDSLAKEWLSRIEHQ